MGLYLILTILCMFIVDVLLYQVHLRFPEARRSLLLAHVLVGMGFGYVFSLVLGLSDARRLLAMGVGTVINLNAYLVIIRRKY
jgi:hypothetical protein